MLANLRKRRRGSGAPRKKGTATPTDTSETSAELDAALFGWPVTDADTISPRHRVNSGSLWGRESDLADLMAHPVRPRLAVAPDLLLRQLDPEPLGPKAERIQEALRPMYEAMTAAAAAVTIGTDESQRPE